MEVHHHTYITIIITTTGAVAEEEDLVLYVPSHIYNHLCTHKLAYTYPQTDTHSSVILSSAFNVDYELNLAGAIIFHVKSKFSQIIPELWLVDC